MQNIGLNKVKHISLQDCSKPFIPESEWPVLKEGTWCAPADTMVVPPYLALQAHLWASFSEGNIPTN